MLIDRTVLVFLAMLLFHRTNNGPVLTTIYINKAALRPNLVLQQNPAGLCGSLAQGVIENEWEMLHFHHRTRFGVNVA